MDSTEIISKKIINLYDLNYFLQNKWDLNKFKENKIIIFKQVTIWLINNMKLYNLGCPY